MAKTEDIEAKLAAYVDGELDPAGRAEIEQHLANNVQHRQLIKELMQQRDLLRSLPRESAPLEVAESVNASLERAVLLGDVDGESDAAALRIRPWSQFRAIAAILFFTASLAAVIYYLLPSPNHRPELAADLRQSAIPTTASSLSEPSTSNANLIVMSTDGATDRPASSTTNPAGGAITEQQMRSAVALRDIGLGDRNIIVSNSEPRYPTDPRDNVMSNGKLEMFQTVATTMPPRPPAELGTASQLVVVLASADPETTTRDVTQYLTRLNVAWETAAEPMPAPLDINPRTQTAFPSRMQQQSVQLKGSEPTSTPAIEITGTLTLPGSGQSADDSQDRNRLYASSGSNRIGAGAGRGGFGGAQDRRQTEFTLAATPTPTERKIVVRRISRQRATELQVAIQSLHPGRGASLSIASATPMTMNGFQSPDQFADDRVRQMARDIQKQLSTTAPADVVAAAEHAPTTAPTTSSAEASTVGPDISPATGPTTMASVPSFNASAINFSLTPTQAPSIDFRVPTTAEATPSVSVDTNAMIPAAPTTQQSQSPQASDLVDVIILVQAASPTVPASPEVPATQPSTQPVDPAAPLMP